MVDERMPLGACVWIVNTHTYIYNRTSNLGFGMHPATATGRSTGVERWRLWMQSAASRALAPACNQRSIERSARERWRSSLQMVGVGIRLLGYFRGFLEDH